MDLESTLGKMEESTKANTTMIRSMDTENIVGRMEGSSKASGQTANVKAKAK
jgi:hypothetical protein